MPTTGPSIRSQLQSAISDVQAKSSQSVEGTRSQQTAADTANQAQGAIRVKETLVNSKEAVLDDILQKIAPPPTKEISDGKNGSKTVVDQQELAKLQSQKTNAMTQLSQAKSDVETARSDAADAAGKALTAAGVNRDTQAEMATLMNQINSINDQLGDGKKVEDRDVENVLAKYNQIAGGLGQDDNKAGIISKAFYDPVKRGLQDMLKNLENPTTARNTNPDTTPGANTVNATLQGLGITGAQQENVINFMERVSNARNEQVAGRPMNTAAAIQLNSDYQGIKDTLTPQQAGAQVFRDLEASVRGPQGVIAASGHADVIAPVGAATGS